MSKTTTQPNKPGLSPEALEIVKEYLEEFKATKSKTARKAIIARAAMHVNDDNEDRPLVQAQVRKMVDNWLRNNGRRPRKPLVNYDHGSRRVKLFIEEHRAELEERTTEASGEHPGGRQYLAHFQTVRKQMMDEMSETEREAFEERVRELHQGPQPRESQLKNASKNTAQAVVQFSNYMYDKIGTRVFVLSAAKDADNVVSVSWHDYNDLHGGISFTDSQPDWNSGSIMDAFKRYAEESFGDFDGSKDLEPSGKRKKKAKSQLVLETDEDDLPILPDEDPTTAKDTEAVVRQFFTGYYRYVCGHSNWPVPWNSIVNSQDEFLGEEYVPEGVMIKDPSHINRRDGLKFIQLWRTREAEGRAPLDFKVYKSLDNELYPVKRSTTDLFQTRSNSKGKGKAKKRPAASQKSKRGSRKKQKATQSTRQTRSQKRSAPKQQTKQLSENDESVNEGSESEQGTTTTDDKDAPNDSMVENDDESAPGDEEDYGVENSSDGEESSVSSTDEAPPPTDEDEGLAAELHDIQLETRQVAEHVAGPSKKRKGDPPPAGSPASIQASGPEARKEFLLSLATRNEYQQLVEAVYSDNTIAKPITVISFPSFAQWSYQSPYLPTSVHSNRQTGERWIKWLQDAPHRTNEGSYISQYHSESFAMVIGLFLHDLYLGHFQEEGEDMTGDHPTFLGHTMLQFAWIDDVLIPLCAKEAELLRRKQTRPKPRKITRAKAIEQPSEAEDSPPPAEQSRVAPTQTQARVQPSRTKKNKGWHPSQR